MYKISKYWFLTVIVLLLGWFFIFQGGFLSHFPIFIWAVTAVAVLYKAKRSKAGSLQKKEKIGIIAVGSFFCIFSFISVPLGFGNPPYSIAEFSILLSGITLILFAYLEFKPILLPSSIPLIAVLGFQTYELFEENVEWIASPLLGPTTKLTVIALNILGVGVSQSNNTISFLTQQGQPMNIPIVIDCTGIWSLGAFTASILLVMLVFPKVLSRKGAVFVGIGYVGTYLANILRVTLICMSAYFYGYSGATQMVHIHAGWIAFSLWMIAFWYFFFSRYLLKK
ncbi:MAG: hypothetical protein A7315_07510 [Candidatus Altiarchaeales archaeon WOR_SM1_79]|nr:MAG: hypothetical protein A7315_07510 [Candidatus Altiarchaeales archaeon WOR_SM1_79]